MSASIHYETADGTDVIERDEYHTDKDGYVIGYDVSSGRENVCIPKERVVIVHD